MVREKAASQKRDVERALTRFIAKTGKIHNLFKTDDNNLFPLISCERDVDSTKTLPYLSAVLFKDQVFEEDEREFEKKKEKKRKSIEKDLNEEGDKANLSSPVVNPEMELWKTANSKGTKFDLIKSWR